MTTPADILACIAEGRLDAVRARATALSNTLAEVEEMVREMRPTSEPVTVESGNTADLADLEEMRDILDGADYAPTPDGLRGMAEDLDRRHNEVASAKDGLMLIVSHDDIEDLTLAQLVTAAGEALEGARAARDRLAGDLSILAAECARIDRAIAPLWTGDLSDTIGERVESVAKAALDCIEALDSLYDKLRERDAKIAALTPGPWRTVAEEAPPRGEMVAIVNNGDGAAFVYVTEIPSTSTADWVKLWRRLPAGLLDVPALAVAPANAQPEGARRWSR